MGLTKGGGFNKTKGSLEEVKEHLLRLERESESKHNGNHIQESHFSNHKQESTSHYRFSFGFFWVPSRLFAFDWEVNILREKNYLLNKNKLHVHKLNFPNE